MDTEGNLYGTTIGQPHYEFGNIYKLVRNHFPDGSGVFYRLEYLYYFTVDSPAGYGPIARVILDANGDIFGTTALGDNFPGSVFELVPNDQLFPPYYDLKVLYTFSEDGLDIDASLGGMVMDSAGNLFGTSFAGSPEFGTELGLVWQLELAK